MSKQARLLPEGTILAKKLSVDGGELVAQSGALYKTLYLGGSSKVMTLSTLKRVADLVEQGVTVIGAAPERSPAFQDDPAEFKSLVAKLWGGNTHGKAGS